ncbi:MAG: site-2 protease family protein [Prosthecochloris sp.]|nr:site-2 protease family protein [Prosthecochloris sp.]
MRPDPDWQRRSILRQQNYPLHALLFLLTLLTTLWAGAFWTGQPVRFSSPGVFLNDLTNGTEYACALLLFLACHEFGHFFAALYHRMKATLPYFIPVPPLPFLLSIGTLGAVIQIKQQITDTKALFDTGAAGPIAGFAVSLSLLIYGFTHLPPPEYIFTIHPEYLAGGGIPDPPASGTLFLGKNLLYLFLEIALRPRNLPPMTEMYHYPFLFTGWLGCFVTALNLLPVGQLDGGHILYAMFGKKTHRILASAFLGIIFILGLPSAIIMLQELLLPSSKALVPESLLEWSWPGWLLWALILKNMVGTTHPPTLNDHRLTTGRSWTGWLTVVIFALCFTPVPFGIT